MANTLTPQQIAAIQAAMSGTGTYQDPTSGTSYGMLNSSGAPQELFGNGMYTAGSGKPLDPYNILDAQGADTGRTGQYADDFSAEMLALKYMAALASVGYAGSAMAGAGGGAGAAGATTGATGTMPYMSMLEAPAAAGLEPYVMGAGAGTGALGAGAGGAVPWEAGFEGTGALSGPGAVAGAGTVGGSSLLSGITGSGLLGPAASVIGGLLGSQPQSSERTTQSQIDPRMASILYDGPNAFMPQVQQQLQRSTSPERQAGWDQMRNAGLGLLQQPIAGNGFSRLTGR